MTKYFVNIPDNSFSYFYGKHDTIYTTFDKIHVLQLFSNIKFEKGTIRKVLAVLDSIAIILSQTRIEHFVQKSCSIGFVPIYN